MLHDPELPGQGGGHSHTSLAVYKADETLDEVPTSRAVIIMKSLATLFTAALLLAFAGAKEHYVHQVCAGAGPECLSKASTCGEKMKPNAEYKQQFHEAYLLCEAKSDESKDESPESSEDSLDDEFGEHSKCIMEETGFMTGWEMNRDTIKAYISTLNLSEELKTALDTAADTCENPTVGDVFAFDKCLLAACIEAV
ncbi:uncharacterized protein [Penaeus vannamei]|uniref:Uncharacterized protein n=1 Tax=Penaeus vannamei TaxID=6689 RepID=A0A3R7LY99_PENVA|nr:uncharacterized protein LOC113818765 [Penaeus vannamei]ROT66462.1 hypothetical protein C7M84_015509 [Penaeus vannamei]